MEPFCLPRATQARAIQMPAVVPPLLGGGASGASSNHPTRSPRHLSGTERSFATEQRAHIKCQYWVPSLYVGTWSHWNEMRKSRCKTAPRQITSWCHPSLVSSKLNTAMSIFRASYLASCLQHACVSPDSIARLFLAAFRLF